MANFKPTFWKPGTEVPGSSEDRTSLESGHASDFVYNPYHSLALEQQRRRLPIFRVRNHILYLAENFQTTIVVGETGCGKSTQIPQYFVEAGWTTDGKMVGVTQPRRVAATTLANRVAEERGAILGDEVGYRIRFDDCWDADRTRIKFLTEGILVREMMGDPLLRQYRVILLDEVHERNLDSDILLGLLAKVIRHRPDLRLIVASATLDAEALRDFFNLKDGKTVTEDTATILTVEGRTYPVDIHYMLNPVPDYVKASVDTVMKIHDKEPEGDVLVFLTGQEEVENAVSMLIDQARQRQEGNNKLKLQIVPLYSSLSASDQLKVFRATAQGTRKVVVATNIAETSVTIRGIVYIVDCGFVKLRYFNHKTCTDCLSVVPISQASAEQRAGRAGRIRSGKAYRLFKEEEFDKLELNTVPEIQRTSLAAALLQLKALGIENILRFSFPAAPPSRNVVNALEILYALGALDDKGQLTHPLGMRMAEFPLHPMFSKMLLVSGDMGCSDEVVTIAAMLQVQNVFSTHSQSNQARKALRLFCVAEGDLITLLNVHDAFIKHHKNKAWCQQNYLNYKGLVRALEIRQQLIKLLKKFKIPLISSEGDVDLVCRCIVSGFFANAAYLHHSGTYKTIRGDHPLHIHPSSVLYTEKQPQWVIFNEVLHTSREFMRDITVIQPNWLYELAPHYYQYGTDRELAAASFSLP